MMTSRCLLYLTDEEAEAHSFMVTSRSHTDNGRGQIKIWDWVTAQVIPTTSLPFLFKSPEQTETPIDQL